MTGQTLLNCTGTKVWVSSWRVTDLITLILLKYPSADCDVLLFLRKIDCSGVIFQWITSNGDEIPIRHSYEAFTRFDRVDMIIGVIKTGYCRGGDYFRDKGSHVFFRRPEMDEKGNPSRDQEGSLVFIKNLRGRSRFIN